MRLSAIGDVVHTLPAAAALKRAGWQVSWLVEPLSRPLVEGSPAVERVFVAPPARRFRISEARAVRAALRAERAEVALDLQGLWKSAAWARAAGARRVVGYAGEARREPPSAWLLHERWPRPQDAAHVIDLNLALLRALGVEAVGTRAFPLPAPPAAEEAVSAGLAPLGGAPFALLNPGGGWASKVWTPEGFGNVARGLAERGLTPFVTWGPGEEALADAVVAASAGAARRCFPTTLLELAALARRARLLVAADTGPLHLACAVGTPVVALFGPTDPARNGPFDARDQVVRRVPSCAPCHRRDCPRHAGIMKTITADEVLAAADRRLACA